MSLKTSEPLIAGAGPVGLAAALFLARRGIRTRIIDQAPEASPYSKALAVNPRTMEILEPSGVTARMLELGRPLQQVQLWDDGGLVATAQLKLEHKYPFMLALSQAVTERLLTEALEEQGGKVERGLRLYGCQLRDGGIQAELEAPAGGHKESAAPPWLFAADGSHSAVRQALGIGFPGSSRKAEWYLVDVGLKTSLPEDTAHAHFLDAGGFIFLIPVVDAAQQRQCAAPLWRILGNMPDLLARLPHGTPVGKPVWESSFHIGHRMAARMQEGSVFLGGDAAHIHSPMGARGMNLGIEDAWCFDALMACGRVKEYGRIRHGIDHSVVKRVRMMTHVVSGETAITRFLRRHLVPRVIGSPALFGKLNKSLTGLDHPLEVC
jgi:2-polyprenyl-6-methoxyphenol hydroxylase-like FAD-dependent oxidoreductase